MVSQAFSASANVLKGDPPTLMAGLLKLIGRQEATKPGCPWRPGPFRLSLLITNEKSRSVALHISSSSDAGATRLKFRAITPPSRPRSASRSDLSASCRRRGFDSFRDGSWSGKICSPHQPAQFAWFATLVCKWRRSPTIRDAIDGLTRHAADRVQSSSRARMAGNTQLV